MQKLFIPKKWPSSGKEAIIKKNTTKSPNKIDDKNDIPWEENETIICKAEIYRIGVCATNIIFQLGWGNYVLTYVYICFMICTLVYKYFIRKKDLCVKIGVNRIWYS